jgi:vacuolar-type H+-ATPase subunit I/STV1
MNKVKNFLATNYKTIFKIGLVVFALYWVVFVLTPRTSISEQQKQDLDSLYAQIKILHEDNLKLEEEITSFNEEIKQVDSKIAKIKNQKTIVKEIYHEKINSVDRLTVRELDSFFTDRYK